MAASASAVTVPLAQLRPGNEAKPPVNIRATDPAAADIAPLAANIADRIAAGDRPLIEPLVVVEGPKPRGGARLYYVCNGGRRLAALLRLKDQGLITEALQLPVVIEAKAAGLEASTTAAVLAAPHHPVEQFEAFARIARDKAGRPEAEVVGFIAQRFGLTARRVRQVVAIGNLAPEVRQAWKAGHITRDVAEAFAVEPFQAAQADLLFSLQHRLDYLSPAEVRRALLRDRVSSNAPEFLFVSEAYAAEGGTLTGDLFTEERYVADPELLRRLIREKRAAIADDFRRQGWGFVFWSDQPEAMGWFTWQRIDRDPVWTPEAEARAGVIRNEMAAIDASRQARENEEPDDDFEEDDAEVYADDDEGPFSAVEEPAAEAPPLLADQRQALVDELAVLKTEAELRGFTAEDRAGSAVVLGWNSRLIVNPGRVPPGLAGEADVDDEDPAPADAPGTGAPEAPQPETAEAGADFNRAARQSLSLIANRAAAATVAADVDLALSLLAAAWIARADDVHAPGNGAPLIVRDEGLKAGPAGDLIADLVAGDGGRADRWQKDKRKAHFVGLAMEIEAMSRTRRLELVAALAAGALDLSNDTLENRNNHYGQKNLSAEGIAAFMSRLPPKSFETNARLILAGSGEAEALFADWPKAALVQAVEEMDGEAAAASAAKAKKAALVTLVAERARATGWLPWSLRLGTPTSPEVDDIDEQEAA